MQETFDTILERIDFEDKDKVKKLLLRSIKVSNDTSKSTYAIHDNVLFKIDAFFLELKKVINQIPKAKKLPFSIELLTITLDELGVEASKEEIFILHHIKDLGKFSIKDKKLKDELKSEWGQYKEYQLNDQDFAYSLKSMMRTGLIEFRSGTIRIKPSLVIRYKN